MSETIYEKEFCVYLVWHNSSFEKQRNPKLPLFYIGSGNTQKILDGKYYGSVCSKKYKEIYQNEVKENPELFDVIILDQYENRKIATKIEHDLQVKYGAVKSPVFINMSLAAPNGFCGMNKKGIPATGKITKGTPRPPATGKHAKGIPRGPAKGKMSKGNPATGKNTKGMPRLFRVGIPSPKKGIPATGKSAKGSTQTKVVCPHCGKEGGQTIMGRWHGEKCKFKPL